MSAIFYSASTLSGVFAGLIAYGVQKDLEDVGGRRSWRWLFLIEGVVAIGIGLLNATILPTFPAHMKNSKIFRPEEIQTALKRSSRHNVERPKFQTKQILLSLRDPKSWFMALLSGCNSTILASTGAFLPTIVNEFGYSKVQAQLFTVIPYACAFFSMIIVGYLSDRYRSKSWFILAALACCFIGLIILISTTGRGTGMFGACLLLTGAYPSAVMQIAWTQITFCGETKRATSWGLAMVFGQSLSMAGSQIYSDGPRFFQGHGVLLGLVTVGIVSTTALRFLMTRANKQRELELHEYEQRGAVHPDLAKDFEETCDNHIKFRYIV